MLESIKRIMSTRPIIFFSIIMFAKSLLAWMVIFEGGPSITTLLKEAPFVLVIFCLIEWFAGKRKLFYYWLANLLMTSILFAVIMYYKYYGVIVTYHALGQVNQVGAVRNSVFSLIQPYYLFIFTDIIILAIYLLIRNKNKNNDQFNGPKNKRLIASVLTVSLALCLFNILPNRASMNEIVKAEQMGILNYEAYTILSATSEAEVVDSEQITQQNISSVKNIESPIEKAQKFATAKGKNLIIIQMESLQNFLVDLKIDGQEIMPVFNSLAHNSHYFRHFYQQVGQGNTSDAEFVVNTSLYIPPRGAATQVYADKELPSLPKLLKKSGYDTATFHTNVVEFWNRGELYKAVGFDRYYDEQFFGKENAIFFGAPDEILYEKTAEELERMNNQSNPFYAQVISMTAHHPFTIPDDLSRITLPDRYNNTMVGDYLRSQNYADYALGLFIEDLKKRGVWEDSLIVLYGDHLGLPMYSLTREEKDLMEEIYGREYTYTDMINIPFIVINPGDQAAEVHEQLGGQIDILPTVANLLGVSLEDQIHFGQDLFNNAYNILPQRYYLPTGSFLSSKELFLSGSGYEDGTHYSLAGDGLSSEQAATEDEFERALELLKLSDSYVKQLPSWKK
ncbi:LTA synthase family protein [Paenibacillus sp. GXUN7292]|uniref:LTA synthase family protein n=1 Tax=Paenibacillus sp. GXUN7292 TaxID=3422499 RepID=UPI003D7C9D8F